MRVLIVAGEASGDLHGSGVVRELKRRAPQCDVYGIGGDKMEAAGMSLVYHVRELSFMGFWEVLQHLPLIRSVQRTLEALLIARKPDVVLLIDYPGFNLRFAQTARKHGIKIIYYISPQVWAWNAGRVKKMRSLIDRMLVVFPFEVEIYKKEGINVEFVGHPLVEEMGATQGRPEFLKRWALDGTRQILGLFPGSRRQEIERIFPPMLGAARFLHQQYRTQTVVGVSSVIEMQFIKSFLRDDFPVTLVQLATHDVMSNSDVAIVTSGTATLETGFLRTPMVVVYKTSLFTYIIGRLLVRIRNIGLVNIVAGERVVPELVQFDATPGKIADAAGKLLGSAEARQKISVSLGVIRERLGSAGASSKVAEAIMAIV